MRQAVVVVLVHGEKRQGNGTTVWIFSALSDGRVINDVGNGDGLVERQEYQLGRVGRGQVTGRRRVHAPAFRCFATVPVQNGKIVH